MKNAMEEVKTRVYHLLNEIDSIRTFIENHPDDIPAITVKEIGKAATHLDNAIIERVK